MVAQVLVANAHAWDHDTEYSVCGHVKPTHKKWQREITQAKFLVVCRVCVHVMVTQFNEAYHGWDPGNTRECGINPLLLWRMRKGVLRIRERE